MSRWTTPVLLVLTVLAMQPARADWPQANGPDGNFNPRRYGHALVDDLAAVRTAWVSQYRDLGYGKGSVSGYLQILASYPSHPGSCSGPIVAQGIVFASSFRPSGDAWAENLPQLRSDSAQRLLQEHGEQLRRNLRIAADDLLVAIDAGTGHTLWEAVEAGCGANRYMGKREGFGVAPAYHEGRVFSMGTTGRLYAYDAQTGRRLWASDIGPAHAQMETLKQLALQQGKLVASFGWDASLVVADGVLVVPMFDHPVDTGLRGVDPDDGSQLWELRGVNSRYATPAVWTHGKRQYVLVANRSGQMRLIEPRSGQVLWTVDGLGPTWFALAPSAEHVLVNAGTATAGSKQTPFGLLAAYRLTPQQAQRAWVMPDRAASWFENHMDSCAKRRVLIRDGRVYVHTHNKVDESKQRYLTIMDERTGRVLHQHEAWPGDSQMYLVEDKLLHIIDASHSDRLTMQLYGSEGDGLRPLGAVWKPPQDTTTGYEVFLECPYVDGRLYMRTREGDIRCYDLRRGSE